MSAVVAERVAALEAERSIPTPRRPKPDLNAPDTPAQQAARRAELLASLRGASLKPESTNQRQS